MNHIRFTIGRTAIAALGLALVVVFLLTPENASAHETRTIGGGQYTAVVGWDTEPAFEGQKNGASIRVSRADTDPAEPVEGLQDTLRVQIRQGGETEEFDLRTPFRQPGYYVADIIPTRPGHYQFTFVGTINGEPVNERFDTADGQFNPVEEIETLQFPIAVGGLAEVAQLASAAEDARAAAQTAQTFGIAGLVVGSLGLLAAIWAIATRPRPAPGDGR